MKVALSELRDVLLANLPIGPPSVPLGYECKIHLEDDAHPDHRPIDELSTMELYDINFKLNICCKMASYASPRLLKMPLYCLYRKQ